MQVHQFGQHLIEKKYVLINNNKQNSKQMRQNTHLQLSNKNASIVSISLFLNSGLSQPATDSKPQRKAYLDKFAQPKAASHSGEAASSAQSWILQANSPSR